MGIYTNIFRKGFVIGYVIALAIICFFAWYTYLNMRKVDRESDHVEEALKSLQTIERISINVQDMEASKRNYISSGDKLYLEQFDRAVKNMQVDTTNLKRSLAGKGNDLRFQDMMMLIDKKIAYITESIRIRDVYGFDSALARVHAEEGRMLLDLIRGHVKRIEAAERDVLVEYTASRRLKARQTTILFSVLSATFILFVIGFFILERQEVRRRFSREVALEVDRELVDFRDILDRINDGFIAADKNWQCVYINNKACKFFSKEREEIIDKHIWSLYPMGRNGEIYNACHKAMTTQQYVFLESQQAESRRWFENHIYPSPKGVSIYFKDVTEKKNAEKELERVTERFNIVTKATNDVLWEADLVNNTMWWNENFYAKFGYSKESGHLDSTSWEHHLHPDDRIRLAKDLEAVLADINRFTWTDEYRFQKADGKYLHVYDRSYIVRDPAGKAIKMIGSMADITKLFETRRELSRQEEQYRNLVDTMDGIVWEADARTYCFNFVSRQAERILGYPVEQWFNEKDFWSNRIHAEDRNWAINYCISQTQEKKPHVFEYRMIAADGRIVWLRDYVSLVLENDEPTLLRGIMIDITESKTNEEALKISEENYKTLVEQATDGIFISSVDGRFMMVNSSGCKMSQYSLEELRNMTIFDLADPGDVARNPFRFDEMKSEQGVQLERKMRKKDGSVIDIEVNSKFIADGRFLAFIRDITGRKKAEEALKASEKQLDLIYNTASDILFLVVPEPGGRFRFQSINKKFETATGLSREQVVGHYVEEIIPPASIGYILEYYRTAIQKQETVSWEEISAYPTGSRTGIVSVTPFCNEEGECMGLVGSVHDITERKKVEDELLRSNIRFELIARTTNDALWEWEFQSNKAWGNEMHQQLYGLEPFDPVPGQDEWRNRIHPEDRDKVIASYQAAMASGKNIWLSEYRFLSAKNNMITIYDRTYIQRDDKGKPIRMMGSMMDISVLKKAEQEIMKGKELADKIIDSLPGVFYFYDSDGNFIRWNSQFEKVTGYSADEISKMSATEFFREEDREYITEKIAGVFSQGVNEAEARLKTKSGEVIPYYFKAVLITLDGKPCLLGSGVDMSERVKMEEELRLSERKYRSLVEQAADAIIIFTQEGWIVDTNPTSTKLLGYNRAELTSRKLTDIMFADDVANDPIIYDLLGKGDSIIKRRRFRAKDGRAIPVEVHSKKLPDGRYLGMIRDLTERIEAERQLQESYRQIRELTGHLQNIREQERSHIAREIHDELGQQLTVLKMDVSWLNKKVGAGDEEIKSKLKSLTAMLDGTVKTVRRISSELRPSLLDDLGLVAAIDWHLREFENRSGVHTDFSEPEGDLDLTDTVKTGIFRIFQESLTNVARHAEARSVKVDLHRDNGSIVLRIEDDGKGFNKLQANSRRTLGILGMKERTTMMGGTYDISSESGKGTVVVVSVPV
jgi:PAS domain S-box-containing protein